MAKQIFKALKYFIPFTPSLRQKIQINFNLILKKKKTTQIFIKRA